MRLFRFFSYTRNAIQTTTGVYVILYWKITFVFADWMHTIKNAEIGKNKEIKNAETCQNAI